MYNNGSLKISSNLYDFILIGHRDKKNLVIQTEMASRFKYTYGIQDIQIFRFKRI